MTPKEKMVPLTKLSEWQRGLPVNEGANRALSAAAEVANLKGKKKMDAKCLLEGLARVSTQELDLPRLVANAEKELVMLDDQFRRGFTTAPLVIGRPSIPGICKLIEALTGQRQERAAQAHKTSEEQSASHGGCPDPC